MENNNPTDNQITEIVESVLKLLNEKKYQEALSCLDPLIKFNNTPENIHLIRAMIYLAQGLKHLAYNSLCAELVLYPNNAKAIKDKQQLLSAPGSEDFSSDATEFHSSNGLNNISVIQRGVELFDQSEWVPASEHFQSISNACPDVTGLNYASMVCHVRRQKFSEAVCFAGKELLIELHKETVALLDSVIKNNLSPIVNSEGFRK